MCVKEFLGYKCGHCSVPVLIQCPLSASNPVFPVCAIPAERPIHTNENCHPCARVVWNIKVLRDEDEHRTRHLRKECGCEVIFEGEERDRPRPGKGVTKVNNGGDSLTRRFEQHDYEESIKKEAVLPPSAGLAAIRQDWEPQSQLAAYDFVGYFSGHQGGGVQMVHPGMSYSTLDGGHDSSTANLMAGQFGAGMKWHPQEQPSHQEATLSIRSKRCGPKAVSEPMSRCGIPRLTDTTTTVEGNDRPKLELAGPTVVSGEMARPDSN